jgi:hypothetical protein
MSVPGLFSHQTPAERCVRFSGALTVLAVALVILLFAFPTAWLREVGWTLFISFLAAAGGATVFAIAAAVVRGAREAVGAALALVGLNLITFLGVIVALFNFRMGVP